MDRQTIIELVEEIDTTKAYELLSHPESGGICVFIGSVRNVTQQAAVDALFFEAYEKMAISEMQKIADRAMEKWPINALIMHHATGHKEVEEAVVMVGVSTPHRDACFEACRFLIDTLKETVPIWKKEFFADKTVWVSSTP